MSADRYDEEARRAEIAERRARARASSPSLLPEQRLVGGVIYGPPATGRIGDLLPGDLLLRVEKRPLGEVVERVCASRRSRSRLLVLLRSADGLRLSASPDCRVLYRRPAAA